jgi:hypothetical protein
MQHHIMAIRTATTNIQEPQAEIDLGVKRILFDGMAAGGCYEPAGVFVHRAGVMADHNRGVLRFCGLLPMRSVGMV